MSEAQCAAILSAHYGLMCRTNCPIFKMHRPSRLNPGRLWRLLFGGNDAVQNASAISDTSP